MASTVYFDRIAPPNASLDAYVEVADLVADYGGVGLTFTNAAALSSETSLKEGVVVRTLGRNFLSDGGGAIYSISNTQTTSYLGYASILLANGLYANYVPLGGTVGAKQFGAVGNNSNNDFGALQAAIDYAAGSYRVDTGRGTFLISEELKLPSNTWLYGAGIPNTLIKLAFNHAGSNNVITNSENTRDASNAGNSNIYVGDLSVHTNFDNSSDQNNGTSTSASGVGFANVHYTTIERVRVIEAKGNHGIDIEASVYSRAGGTVTLDYGESPITAGYPATDNGDGTWTSTDGAVTNDVTYQPGSSSYVWIIDCQVGNWGDDGITVHDSEYVWIVRPVCIQNLPLGGNTNGIEIDDGSRRIWVTDPYCQGCKIAVCVKAHYNAPAPYDVTVENIQSLSCAIGFRCYHTDHMDSSLPSPTANNISVDGIHYLRPIAGDSDGVHAVSLQSYAGVDIRAVHLNGRGTAYGRANDLIAVNGWARGVSFDGIRANNWNLADGSAIWRSSSSSGPGLSVSNVYAEAVNGNGVTSTGGAEGLNLSNITLIGDDLPFQYTGISITGGGSSDTRGSNYITGYATAIA